MSDGSNSDSDMMAEKNSPNFLINLQESFSSSNNLNNDYEISKSGTNAISHSKISSTKNFSQNTASNIQFSSENSYSKHKISSNSLNQKFSNKRLEPLFTDPNTTSETKSKSPKKVRFTMFKMVKKSKYKNFFESPVNLSKKIEEVENETGRERRDVYGNLINRKNKRKVRVTFIDDIDDEKPLVSVIKVESYKKYNFILGMPNENVINKNIKTNCQCCTIF